jgi:hypothetical protein
MKIKTTWLVKPALVLVVLSFCIPCVAQTPWQIRKFEVVQSKPNSLYHDVLEALDVGTVDEETVELIEAYLTSVARRYEALGFRPPAIDYLSDDGTAFQVFLYDYDDTEKAAAYLARCGGANYRSYFYIDSSRLMKNGSIKPKFYEHLAHELFHSVQYSYPLFQKNCSLGNWITEGTAEVMGIETVRRLRGVKESNPQVRMGARNYSNSLRVGLEDSRRNSAYWTSSLWRYIGEHIAAARGGGRAEAKATNPRDPLNPDMRYLHMLFKRNLPGEPSEDVELDWLDSGLKDIIGLGLGRIFPNFITTFASYVPERAGADNPEFVEWWHSWVFGGCPKISLSEQAPEASIPLDLTRVSASCFVLDIPLPDRVDVMFHVDNVEKEELRALSIGTAQGSKVGKSFLIDLNEGTGKYFGAWKFRVPTDEPQLFVVSNAAWKASSTRAQQPVLQVALASWENNLANSRGQKQPPGDPAAPKSKRENPDPTAVKTAEEYESGMQSLSSHIAGGGALSRKSNEAPCADAFQYIACGPRTNISLSLLPGSAFTGFGYVTGTGGSGAQMMSVFSGIAEAGAAQLSQEWQASMEELQATEGGTVSISIPMIDYGFTGSFDNANMIVSGKNGATYRAEGPADDIPGPGIGFPLSGKVTIEKYTPYVLKGSFSADLVDVSNRPPFESQDPVSPIAASIEGSFHIVGPWQGDRRTEYVPPDNEMAVHRQDLNEAFPAIGSGMAEERVSESGNAAGSAGGGGSPVLVLSKESLLGQWLWTHMRRSNGGELKVNRMVEFLPDDELVLYDAAGEIHSRGSFVASEDEIRVDNGVSGEQVWKVILFEGDRLHVNHQGNEHFFARQ